MTVDTESHDSSLCKDWETMECSAFKGTSVSHPLPQGSGTVAEEGTRKTVRARGSRYLPSDIFQPRQWNCTHELTSAAHTSLGWRGGRWLHLSFSGPTHVLALPPFWGSVSCIPGWLLTQPCYVVKGILTFWSAYFSLLSPWITSVSVAPC